MAWTLGDTTRSRVTASLLFRPLFCFGQAIEASDRQHVLAAGGEDGDYYYYFWPVAVSFTVPGRHTPHTCRHTQTRTHVRTYARTTVCMDGCMYVCTYTHARARAPTHTHSLTHSFTRPPPLGQKVPLARPPGAWWRVQTSALPARHYPVYAPKNCCSSSHMLQPVDQITVQSAAANRRPPLPTSIQDVAYGACMIRV